MLGFRFADSWCFSFVTMFRFGPFLRWLRSTRALTAAVTPTATCFSEEKCFLAGGGSLIAGVDSSFF